MGKLSKRIRTMDDILESMEVDGIPSNYGEFNGNDNKSSTFSITFVELAILNSFFMSLSTKKMDEISLVNYGTVDNIGRINFGGDFTPNGSFWYICKLKNGMDVIFQTKIYSDRNELITQLHISVNSFIDFKEMEEIYKDILSLSFNNSEYKGKCIKVRLMEGNFKGIEVIELEPLKNEIILNDTQKSFIDHFISRLNRGGTARYLLNGEPGTGKTESIREIIRKLTPKVTFIIPEFETTNDLSSILEGCGIFNDSVIIMDDVDLYLGSRENGSYTRLLGQFLSFFDGVKKRKISLLASTNDKGLVDKAAERPGRFNFTLDYGFLDEKQIISVCDIHLPEKWRCKEVYSALTEKINGKKANITGAFIANLADNLKEMSEDDENWSLKDTINLIVESYKGFYSSQVERNKDTIGFIKN